MRLFSLDSVQHKSESIKQPVVGVEDLDIQFIEGNNIASIELLISALGEDQSIYFMTDGAWSNIDIIEKLLSIVGCCSMAFCTWSISTDAIRKFTEWQKNGSILSLHVLLDQGLRNRKPEIYQQATAAFKNLQLLKCHAKVAVIENEEFSFTVIGSANFTNNPRKEAGMIIRSKKIARENINWIRKEFENV